MYMRRPNIVFIFTDQQRWDTCGCYGQELNVTPELDAMAANGVRFEYAFTCQPICGPARSCVMTGKYATETGCYKNGVALPEDEITIASLLGDSGYETAYVGKWHLATNLGIDDYMRSPVPVERRGGFSGFWVGADALEFTSDGYSGYVYNQNNQRIDFHKYRADAMTDYAIEFLNTRNKEKPFFLVLSLLEPHQQNSTDTFQCPEGMEKEFASFTPPGDLKEGIGNWEKEYAAYLACCKSIDNNVKRVRQALGEKGLLENTLIIFSSDHGCHFKTRPGEYKRTCHESSIRIPMVIHGPGFTGGQVVDEFASILDIPATIIAAAGIDVPEYIRGRDLHRVINNKYEVKCSSAFIQISEIQVGRAIRTKKYKLSVKAPDANGLIHANSTKYECECLYDLDADPYENENLVSKPDYYDVKCRLVSMLKEYILNIEGYEAEIN